jgi:twitching motility protein PilT
MSYSLSDMMKRLVADEGEAAHLDPGQPPILKIRGVLHRVEGPPLDPGDTEALLQGIASANDLDEFVTSGIVSFYYQFGGAAVFHVTAFRQDGHVHLLIRRFR